MSRVSSHERQPCQYSFSGPPDHSTSFEFVSFSFLPSNVAVGHAGRQHHSYSPPLVCARTQTWESTPRFVFIYLIDNDGATIMYCPDHHPWLWSRSVMMIDPKSQDQHIIDENGQITV